MTRVRLLISTRQGIFDPESAAILKSLKRLKYSPDDLSIGRVITLDFASDDVEQVRAEVEKMAKAFLVNPVSETYKLEFVGEEGGSSDAT